MNDLIRKCSTQSKTICLLWQDTRARGPAHASSALSSSVAQGLLAWRTSLTALPGVSSTIGVPVACHRWCLPITLHLSWSPFSSPSHLLPPLSHFDQFLVSLTEIVRKGRNIFLSHCSAIKPMGSCNNTLLWIYLAWHEKHDLAQVILVQGRLLWQLEALLETRETAIKENMQDFVCQSQGIAWMGHCQF